MKLSSSKLLIISALSVAIPVTSLADRNNTISEAGFSQDQDQTLLVIVAELTAAGLALTGLNFGDPAVQVRKAELSLRMAEELPVTDHPQGLSVDQQRKKLIERILKDESSYKLVPGEAYEMLISDSLTREALERKVNIETSTAVSSAEKAKIINAEKLKLEQLIDLKNSYYAKTAWREGADIPEARRTLTTSEWLKTRGVILGSLAGAGILVVDASRRAYKWYNLDESLQTVQDLENKLKEDSAE